MKKLKHVKTFESFKINEEIAGLAGGIAIGALFAYLSNFVPRLSNNPIKSISRFVKMSRVIKKYKPLIEELDVMFKNDPEINRFYKDIKTIGHGTSNQTTPATYAAMLKHYILHRVPTSMRPKVEDLMRELEKEVKEVGYDVYGEDSYSFESLKINEEVPFNHGEFEESFGNSGWTNKEESDLEILGADEITKDDAVFKQRGFDVIVTKKVSDRTGNVYYHASSNISGSFGHDQDDWDNQFKSGNWDSFLRRLNNFTKIGKVRIYSRDDRYLGEY